MGLISLTLPIAGANITAGLHSTNYTTLQTVINGNLDANNWASGKIFAPSKLTQESAVDGDPLVYDSGSAIWKRGTDQPMRVAALAPGNAADVLTTTGGVAVWEAPSTVINPWLIDIDVFPTAIAQTNWDTVIQDGTYLGGGYKKSSGAQNDEISWDVVLAAGTWTVELIHRQGNTIGIYSVQFDTVEKGTIDGYNAIEVKNVRSSVTGITVATTAKVRLKLKMATKNGASGSYEGNIQHVQLRRTA